VKTYPLTVAMTPSFLMEGDNLFRAQLRCLSEQEFKDFDVVVIDCHYQKRKGYMSELAEKYGLNIVHIPYTPNLRIAKLLDCAIFNAPYLFSESPKIVRYSCWRFVRPKFTQICVESAFSVDFRFHNVIPPSPEWAHPMDGHNTLVWGMGDKVNWGAMPDSYKHVSASWGPDSDVDTKPQLFPLNCYGNYMVPRQEWLRLNGCDEAIFSSEHWEDQDFCQRANNAGIPCWRKHGIQFRLHHTYGNHSGRANILPDFGEFKKPCPKCASHEHDPKPGRRSLKSRAAAGEIEIFDDRVWVCPECFYCGPVFHDDEGEYHRMLKQRGIQRSNIVSKFKVGRNLSAVASDMDGKSLSEKVEIFNRSYEDARYY